MPKGSRSSQRPRLSQSLLLGVHRCTIDQLTCLPAEVLWLHLSSRHLVTSRNKSVMAQRLYHALRNADHSSSIVTTTPPPVPTSPTSTATLCQSTTALSIPSTIPPPLNSTRPIMSSLQPCLLSHLQPSTSEVFISARIAATVDLSHEPSNPISYSSRSQPNSSRNTQSVTCHYSGHAFHT